LTKSLGFHRGLVLGFPAEIKIDRCSGSYIKLTAVVSATQEVDIRKIVVPCQPWQESSQTPTPSQFKKNKTDVVMQICNPSYSGGTGRSL
jgi:hypothetical protein